MIKISEQRESQLELQPWSAIQVGMFTISINSLEIKTLKQKSPGLLVPREKIKQSLGWTVKCPKTNILADGLIRRTSSILDEIA